MKKGFLAASVLLILILIFMPMITTGCTTGGGFGIYLADTGKLVLSDQHIKAYHQNTYTIELNEKGIERWNSFMTYLGIPKLDGTLYNKDFIVKVDGKEMYRGKFYSFASSMSYSGVVILDVLMKRDSKDNSIWIEYGYPASSFGTGVDPRNNTEIIDFFAKRGLLK